MVLATGEDISLGQSLRASVALIELGIDDVNNRLLGELQAGAPTRCCGIEFCTRATGRQTRTRYRVFFRLFRSCLNRGDCHIADRATMGPPEGAQAFDWRRLGDSGFVVSGVRVGLG